MRTAQLVIVALCLAASARPPLAAAPENDASREAGWFFPTIGPGLGTWDASVGLFLGDGRGHVRNLQLRADVDLAAGVRAHAVLRSNREPNTIKHFSPHLDEGYLEGCAFHRAADGAFSGSLRLGNVRYLRFPYPDSIAIFDQVPGIEDLTGERKTGYHGALLTLDYVHRGGLGAHFTGIRWGFDREGGAEVIESYVSYAREHRSIRFEGRLGRLAQRLDPLGRGAAGHNLFIGMRRKGYAAGVLYENLHGQPAYTGVMVAFPSNNATRALGAIAFDYVRSPAGFSAQLPLARGTIGALRRRAPAGGVLVGEIKAERIRTYWQNGQVRNFYEHRISSWGRTRGPGVVVVAVEEPCYLQAEALVSPHARFANWGDLKDWERDRQGPAQVSQRVTYQFWRVFGEGLE